MRESQVGPASSDSAANSFHTAVIRRRFMPRIKHKAIHVALDEVDDPSHDDFIHFYAHMNGHPSVESASNAFMHPIEHNFLLEPAVVPESTTLM